MRVCCLRLKVAHNLVGDSEDCLDAAERVLRCGRERVAQCGLSPLDGVGGNKPPLALFLFDARRFSSLYTAS